MSIKIAERMQNLKGSAGFALLSQAKEMRARGEDVISLAIGEPEGNTYKPICEAGKKAIDEGWTKYSPAGGLPILRKALAQHYSQEFCLDVSAGNVFVGSGCKQVLFGAFQCLCGPKDEVLLPAPYWMSYPPLVKLSGASLKVAPAKPKNHFKITAEELKKNISHKTKAFLLNTPNNPTGAVYSKEELSAIGRVLLQFPHLIIMIDGIYSQLVFSEEENAAPHLLKLYPELKSRILVFDGASKSHLMTGWRLGWLIGPKAFVKTLSAFQSQSAGCANTITQKAFADGFSFCAQEIKNMTQNLKNLRDILTQALTGIKGLEVFPSKGAFYLWLGVGDFIGKKYKERRLKSSQDIMELLMAEKKLICISGEEFGMPGYLRLSYSANKGDITKAGQRLREFFLKIS